MKIFIFGPRPTGSKKPMWITFQLWSLHVPKVRCPEQFNNQVSSPHFENGPQLVFPMVVWSLAIVLSPELLFSLDKLSNAYGNMLQSYFMASVCMIISKLSMRHFSTNSDQQFAN